MYVNHIYNVHEQDYPHDTAINLYNFLLIWVYSHFTWLNAWCVDLFDSPQYLCQPETIWDVFLTWHGWIACEYFIESLYRILSECKKIIELSFQKLGGGGGGEELMWTRNRNCSLHMSSKSIGRCSRALSRCSCTHLNCFPHICLLVWEIALHLFLRCISM